MKGFLLDTCVLSEFQKPHPDPSVQLWLTNIDPRALFLSSITVGELRFGIDLLPDGRKRVDLERWFTTELLVDFAPRILAFDADAAIEWGSIRATACRAGRSAPHVGSMIAAVARRAQLSLVTRNARDFDFVSLPIVNPWQT